MARTRKTTETVEQPDNVVELQPGIHERDPVEQPNLRSRPDQGHTSRWRSAYAVASARPRASILR